MNSLSIENLRERGFEAEICFSATRSSGPGGQNVNKVNTRIELRFNLLQSLLLSAEEKVLISIRLMNRINSQGELILTCQTERTQSANKEKVFEKFYSLLFNALKQRKTRKPTRPSKSSIEKRIQSKRFTSEKKTMRKNPDSD